MAKMYGALAMCPALFKVPYRMNVIAILKTGYYYIFQIY